MEPFRILIVDDDAFIRELVRETLSFDDYQVQEVSTGEAGLTAIAAARPDLILLDVDLGAGIDGFAVCRKIQERDDPPPVIFLTGNTEQADQSKGLEAGARSYLTKPFSPIELINTIQAVRTGK